MLDWIVSSCNAADSVWWCVLLYSVVLCCIAVSYYIVVCCVGLSCAALFGVVVNCAELYCMIAFCLALYSV